MSSNTKKIWNSRKRPLFLLALLPLSLLLLLLLPTHARAENETIVLDSYYIVDGDSDRNRNDPYYDFDFTVPETCQNAYLLVATATWNSDSVNYITYNGDSLTKLLQADWVSGNLDGQIWALIAPDSGTHNMYFTTSGISERPTFVSLYCNVDPNDPIGTSFFIADANQYDNNLNSGTVANYENDNSATIIYWWTGGSDNYSSSTSGYDLVGQSGVWNDGKIGSINNLSVSNLPSGFNLTLSGPAYGATMAYGVLNYIAPVGGGLSITQDQYNPATGNVFLAGTCEKKGSGINQMSLDASQDFEASTTTWTTIDFSRKDLIDCKNDGTWTAMYRGGGLTGTTTIIIDDTFFGTELVTIDIIFYSTTGYIDFNFGDRIEFLTNNASGTPVNLDFNYNICDDPEYSATSSYIYLCADALGEEGEIIHQCEKTNPKAQIATCSGQGTISFSFPYNTIYTGRAYFAYASWVDDTITVVSDYFYLVARPSGIYGMPECSPPSYSLTDVCSGIDTSNMLGDIKCGIKYAVVASGQFLFYPSCSSLEEIGNSYYNFKRSFPFNTFFDLTDAVDEAIQTSLNSTSTPQAFVIPFIRQTATSSEFYMLPVMSSTTITNTIGSTNYDTLKTTLGFVWWIIVGVIVFFTVRKI